MCFLCYPPCYKGYKLLNLETNELFISRDVVFHETIFPFKDTHPSPSLISDFFSYAVLPTHISSSTLKDTQQRTRFGRTVGSPLHLRYYHCYTVASSLPSSTAHPLCSSLVITNFLLFFMHLSIIFLLSLNRNTSLKLLLFPSGDRP